MLPERRQHPAFYDQDAGLRRCFIPGPVGPRGQYDRAVMAGQLFVAGIYFRVVSLAGLGDT